MESRASSGDSGLTNSTNLLQQILTTLQSINERGERLENEVKGIRAEMKKAGKLMTTPTKPLLSASSSNTVGSETVAAKAVTDSLKKGEQEFDRIV